MVEEEALSEDTLLGGTVRLAQPRRGYRAGIDPVLLAAAVPARSRDRVLELGAGAGAAALCLAVRVPGAEVVGLEADAGTAHLAEHNAGLNGLGERVRLIVGDVSAPPSALQPGSFDHVMANPPHLARGTGRRPLTADKVAATIEGEEAGLDRWLGAAVLLVCAGGTVTVVHRADRLDAVLAAMAAGRGPARLGDVTLFPLWPGTGRPAKRVIVAGRKGSRAPMRLLPGLVLHEPDGAFTAAVEAVLRAGKGLELWPSRS